MIEHLKNYGRVLTEIVGDDNLIELEEMIRSDEKIYKRDIARFVNSNVVIAEVSIPSLGVGYELRMVENFNKRHLCLYAPQNGRKLSPMIAGNDFFNIKSYNGLEEAFLHIDDFMKDL